MSYSHRDQGVAQRLLRELGWALALQERVLEPLIVGFLDGDSPQQLESVLAAPFHALDQALNALMELRPTGAVANTAADAFRRTGAGSMRGGGSSAPATAGWRWSPR